MVGTGTQTMSMDSAADRFPSLEIASSGTVVFSGQINVSGNYTYTSGTLTTTGSTLVFYCNNTTCTVTPGTISYNNVQIVTYAGTVAIASGSTMKVGGSLTTNETYGSAYGNINTGTIEVSGDYITSAAFNGGNGLVRMVGTGTISSSGGATPKVEINTAGTITLSGSNHFRNDFTYVAGTVVNTGSTTYFDGSTQTISGGSMVFNDVTFNGNFANPTVSGTMNVGGNLTFAAASASSVNGGTIAVSGNVTLTTLSNGGTVALTFNGTGTQTVSRASGTWPTGNWIINKASGTLTLGSAVSLGGAAQSVTLTSGAINMAGYAFSMKSLSLNGNTLTKNAGVLTVNGVVQGTGSLFGGTVNP
jgi:hypothetical protein